MDFSAANWPRTAETLARAGSLAATAAVHVDRAARNINVYRALAHWDARHSRVGAQYGTDTWGIFARRQNFPLLNQDAVRTPRRRKEDLAACDPYVYLYVNKTLEFARKHPTNNLAVLHRVAMYRLAILGDKSVPESLAYCRRAARKLHPDRCGDLKGWEMPGTFRPLNAPPEAIVEHAAIGAANLFQAHNNLKAILAQPHYAKLLYAKSTILGGQLTIGHLAQDLALFTVVGMAICLAKAKSVAIVAVGSSGCFATLLAVHLFCVVRKKMREARLKKTHQMVLYMPVYPGDRTRGVK